LVKILTGISSESCHTDSLSPQPKTVFCIEKQRLTRAYLQAISEWTRLHRLQLDAVLMGADYTFTKELGAAAYRADEVKYALISHRETHGC